MAGSGTAHLRGDALLTVDQLVVEFPAKRGRKVHAVSNVSFDIARGETVGLVGESGCGKSTTGKTIAGLQKPTSGKIIFDGINTSSLSPGEFRKLRPRLQMIFQDPISSLNPRSTVGRIVREPLRVWGRGDEAERDRRVSEVLAAVGLNPDTVQERKRREFSGGQCQRISIARSLILDPDILVCDEPVSALDVSVQAQILNLLEDMKERYGLTMLVISHDLAVVKNLSDRVIVMYLGKLCEVADSRVLYARPAHPYTESLLASIPVPDPSVKRAAPRARGDLPSPLDPPSGCRFRTRCPRAAERCAIEEPVIREVATGHFVACHFPLVEAQPVSVGSTGADASVSLDAAGGRPS
jgi:peptide/nickel transport system ATP-binding protein